MYSAKLNYYLPLPRARETKYENFGVQVDMAALRIGGGDELNSGVPQEVISQIGRQPTSNGRSTSRVLID
jgi:hypothetical protein